jgi:hypothetical protein
VARRFYPKGIPFLNRPAAQPPSPFRALTDDAWAQLTAWFKKNKVLS